MSIAGALKTVKIEPVSSPKFNIGDRVYTRTKIGTIHNMSRNRAFPEIWTYYVICDDYPTRIWCEEKQLKKATELKWEADMTDLNFRTGGFLRADKLNDKYGWVKYIYLPDLGNDGDLDMDRREISTQVSEYFSEAQHEFFKPLKRELEIKNYLSRTEFNHNGNIRNAPYIWANGRIIVRQGTTLDKKGIVKILDEACEAAQSDVDPQFIRAYLSRGLMIVVTDYTNTIKGFQTITIEPGVVNTGNLLYIRPESRGLGAFGMIYKMIFEAAEHADFDRVYTQCADNNSVAEKYEHIGMKKGKERGSFEINGVTGCYIPFNYEIVKDGYQTFF